MALTNAQRQERYRQSLKAKAQGVTPDMVMQAARMIFECGKDTDSPSWEEFCASAAKRGNVGMWQQFWTEADDKGLMEDLAASGGDVDLVKRVLAVARAVLRSPAK